ncbi:MAG: hypothetical protein ACLRZH_08745 [Ruthenibacterium lactatiformans]
MFELPVIVIGCQQPTILADIPRPAPISTPTIPLPLRWMCWWTS